MRWIRALLFLPASGSTFADDIDLLHFFVISVTMTAAFGIAAVTLYYMLRYRRRSPAQTTVAIRGSTIGEVGIIGAVLGMFLLFWAIGFRQYVHLETPPADAMLIHVTAKQWMWKFSHPGNRRAINVLTVPVGRPIKLLMTSRDVIHSFYVPAFRIKQDVLPGRYVTAWFEATTPGSYDIYCAEYCGTSHSRMLGTVTVLAPPDYDAWLARDESGAMLQEDFAMAGGRGVPEDSDLVAQGRLLAARRQCLACHTVDGQRHIGPTWRKLYGAAIPLDDGTTVIADEAYLTRSMMDPLTEVHAGYRAIMPSYQGVLAAPEVAALIEYIKSLREGDVEQSIALPPINEADPVTPGTPLGRSESRGAGAAGAP